MNFIVYDISILIVFAILVSIFLYTRRKNLKKEGLLLLYKETWGIKFIENIAGKYKRLWKILGYVSIVLGYILMILMVYFFIKIVAVYLFNPEIVRAIKIPPIMPLIPYLPTIFNLDFLPPFYFIYWVIIIAVIAIPHEVAHGICAAYNKIKIKNTGFGFFPFFLPIFLAAFVEPDEKEMTKKNKITQMSILSSGTSANVLTAVIFFFILWGFFSISYAPAGVVFDSYSYSLIDVPSITMINNITANNLTYNETLNILDKDINKLVAGDDYLLSKSIFEDARSKEAYEIGKMLVYDNAPAIRSQLVGAITEIDGVKITSQEKLIEELGKKNPGDKINLKTFTGEGYNEYNIILDEHPELNGRAWLGIGFVEKKRNGIMGRVVNVITLFRESNIYYQPVFGFSEFVYNLLWWIVLISISVALINMLPVGIFDGGRFFYLTIAAITRSEKIAKKAFIGITYLFLILLAMIMFFWAFSFW